MIKVSEINILSILPPIMQNDDDIKAAAKTLDLRFNVLPSDINKLSFMAQKQTDPDLLDVIASDLHVDFYDKTYDVITKQQLIESSNELHNIKGTAAAVEKLISIIFGEGTVEEWFEYGGQPYHFRVLTTNEEVTNARAQEFINALNSVKRRVAVLDSVSLISTEQMGIYFSGIVHVGEVNRIEQVV